MKKKIINLIIIMITCINMNLFCYEIYGADTVDSVIQGAQDFLSVGKDSQVNEEKLKGTSDFIFNLLLAIAMVVAVIVGIIIGIKFMVGGIEEKAKIQESLIPYVIGCVVIFGAFGIWKLAVTVLSTW